MSGFGSHLNFIFSHGKRFESRLEDARQQETLDETSGISTNEAGESLGLIYVTANTLFLSHSVI